jgi:hypothetical protein
MRPSAISFSTRQTLLSAQTLPGFLGEKRRAK